MVIDLSPKHTHSCSASFWHDATQYLVGHDKSVGVFASIQGEVVLGLLLAKPNDRVKPSRHSISSSRAHDISTESRSYRSRPLRAAEREVRAVEPDDFAGELSSRLFLIEPPDDTVSPRPRPKIKAKGVYRHRSSFRVESYLLTV